MRRAFADRARYLGDPDFNPDMPIERLRLEGVRGRAARDDPRRPRLGVLARRPSSGRSESDETTHLSVVDAERNAVSLTYTLEDGYGSKIVVPGAGFLLNNEMGDFNAGPGLTDADGLIGTEPNLAAPGKRMLSSMTPTILAKDGQLFMVIGSPGGRTIINTVLQTILNVVDFGMNVQEAVDAPRFHHQWLPDRIRYERSASRPTPWPCCASAATPWRRSTSQGVAQGDRLERQGRRARGRRRPPRARQRRGGSLREAPPPA